MTEQTPTAATGAQIASRVALVVRGGWDGHQPGEATDLFIPFLEENGFTVRPAGTAASPTPTATSPTT